MFLICSRASLVGTEEETETGAGAGADAGADTGTGANTGAEVRAGSDTPCNLTYSEVVR